MHHCFAMNDTRPARARVPDADRVETDALWRGPRAPVEELMAPDSLAVRPDG